MVTYEKAKELKEVGFPQNKSTKIWLHISEKKIYDKARDFWWTRKEQWKWVYSRNAEKGFPKNMWVANPDLFELIEECGGLKKELTVTGERERFFVLWFVGEKWLAGYAKYGDENYIDDYPFPKEEGMSPEEAVANLYIELKK